MAESVKSDGEWMACWLDAVQGGRATMSQRSRLSVERNGGVAEAIAAAEVRGVHLVELTDDGGKLLITASRHPFRALC